MSLVVGMILPKMLKTTTSLCVFASAAVIAFLFAINLLFQCDAMCCACFWPYHCCKMWNALLSKPKTFKRLLDVARLEPTNVLYYIVNVQMRSENQQMNTCVLKCVGAIVLTKLRNKAAYKLNIYILFERTARSASRNAFEMYLYTFRCIKYRRLCVCCWPFSDLKCRM